MAASQIWIALFRGINVGGHAPLPMKTLPALLEKCGCMDARTYIQSGNVVFRSSVKSAEMLATRISKAVLAAHKHEPRVFLLSRKEFEKALAANPYKAAADEQPQYLHLFFLDGKPPQPKLEKLESLKANGEQFTLKGDVFYLHTPNGFGTSKLAARAMSGLGVDGTARNWRTCTTLGEMAASL
jgi:uncharacterized protein (DUF1697 family)